MKFETLLSIVGDESLCDSGLLLAGDVDSVDPRRQLSRWVSAGWLIQLHRGLYTLADPYRKTVPLKTPIAPPGFRRSVGYPRNGRSAVRTTASHDSQNATIPPRSP